MTSAGDFLDTAVVPTDMSLRTTVAIPFRDRGRDRLAESEFVVALSLDRDWFSPDQAKRLIDVAMGEGLLDHDEGDLIATFEPDEIGCPDEFVPDEGLLRDRSTFERVVDRLVDAGEDKQHAVAAINRLQADLAVTVEAAAILYAHRQGVDVQSLAEQLRAGHD